MAAIFQPYNGGQTTEDTAEDVQDEAPAFDVDVCLLGPGDQHQRGEDLHLL